MTEKGTPGRRSPHVLVVALAASASLTAVLVVCSSFVGLAFGWGYVAAGVALGGAVIAGLMGGMVLLHARARRR